MEAWRAIESLALSQNEEPFWRKARLAIEAGQVEKAHSFLMRSQAAGENQMAVLGTSGLVAEAEGRLEDASSSYLALQDLMAGFYLADDPTLSGMYARFHRRAGFDMQIVPGYLDLSPDVGQFEALESYYHLRVKEEGCTAATETLEILQRAVRGGALGPLPPPDCRGVVMLTEAQTE